MLISLHCDTRRYLIEHLNSKALAMKRNVNIVETSYKIIIDKLIITVRSNTLEGLRNNSVCVTPVSDLTGPPAADISTRRTKQTHLATMSIETMMSILEFICSYFLKPAMQLVKGKFDAMLQANLPTKNFKSAFSGTGRRS